VYFEDLIADSAFTTRAQVLTADAICLASTPRRKMAVAARCRRVLSGHLGAATRKLLAELRFEVDDRFCGVGGMKGALLGGSVGCHGGA
jgi:hypothetical protein